MKILTVIVTRNCAEMIGFTIRHYTAFSDEIWFYDDESDDGTSGVICRRQNQDHESACKVWYHEWPHCGSGIDENLFLKFYYERAAEARRSGFDWVIMPDPDEIIYSPLGVRQVLARANPREQLIRPVGFNMVGPTFPVDDGRQIWEIHKLGIPAPVYSKPIVFRPSWTPRWQRGRHNIECCSVTMGGTPKLRLLHYRYIGREYTARRNATNYDRVGLVNGDKGAAWSCAPNYHGEHSADWAEAVAEKGTNVVDQPLDGCDIRIVSDSVKVNYV